MKAHRYRRSQFSGAGNCECGMPKEYRAHQRIWWRLFHRRHWRLT